MSSTSRKRMLEQIARCAKYQKESITPPAVPTGAPEVYEMGEHVAEEVMGNGQPTVHCDNEFPNQLGQEAGGWA